MKKIYFDKDIRNSLYNHLNKNFNCIERFDTSNDVNEKLLNSCKYDNHTNICGIVNASGYAVSFSLSGHKFHEFKSFSGVSNNGVQVYFENNTLTIIINGQIYSGTPDLYSSQHTITMSQQVQIAYTAIRLKCITTVSNFFNEELQADVYYDTLEQALLDINDNNYANGDTSIGSNSKIKVTIKEDVSVITLLDDYTLDGTDSYIESSVILNLNDNILGFDNFATLNGKQSIDRSEVLEVEDYFEFTSPRFSNTLKIVDGTIKNLMTHGKENATDTYIMMDIKGFRDFQMYNVDVVYNPISTVMKEGYVQLMYVTDANTTIKHCNFSSHMSSTVTSEMIGTSLPSSRKFTEINVATGETVQLSYTSYKPRFRFLYVLNNIQNINFNVLKYNMPNNLRNQLTMENVNAFVDGTYFGCPLCITSYNMRSMLKNCMFKVRNDHYTVYRSDTPASDAYYTDCRFAQNISFTLGSLYMRDCYCSTYTTGPSDSSAGAVFGTSYLNFTLENNEVHGSRDGISCSASTFIIDDEDGVPQLHSIGFTQSISGGFYSSPGHGGLYHSGGLYYYKWNESTQGWDNLTASKLQAIGKAFAHSNDGNIMNKYKIMDVQDADLCWRVFPRGTQYETEDEAHYAGASGAVYYGYGTVTYTDNCSYGIPKYTKYGFSSISMNSRGYPYNIYDHTVQGTVMYCSNLKYPNNTSKTRVDPYDSLFIGKNCIMQKDPTAWTEANIPVNPDPETFDFTSGQKFRIIDNTTYANEDFRRPLPAFVFYGETGDKAK